MNQLLKKTIVLLITILALFCITSLYNNSYAAVEDVINNKTESNLVRLKDKELKSIEDYKRTYGSDSYGVTAYILHKVQVYSIPFSILGILIGAVYDYIIGVRHLETKEKGKALMIMFVTIGVIFQVLPLVFTIVVKFGRE